MRATGKLLQVPVGKGLLGRVVNTLGAPLDGKGPIASDGRLSGREARAGHHPAPSGRAAGADRHHADRRDDPDRPRPARVDHRRSFDGQDDDLHRHDHQSGPPQQGCRGRRRQGLPAAVQHLRGDRTEAIDGRADRRQCSRRPGPCRTPLSSPRRRRTPRRISTSHRLPARRWASGSWTTAWTRSSSTTTCPSTRSPIARCRSS